MSKILFILSFLSISFVTQAQQVNLDSLNKIWLDKTKSDTTRFKAMHIMVQQHFSFNNLDTAFLLAQKILDIALKKGYKSWVGAETNFQGIILQNQNKLPEALEYFHRALKIQEEIDFKRGISDCLGAIGDLYQLKGNFPKAIYYYKRSLKINEDIGKKIGIAACLNRISGMYTAQKNYQKAIEYLVRSLKIEKEIDNKYGIGANYINFGAIHSILGNHEKSSHYFQLALPIFEEIGNKYAITACLDNIGFNLQLQGKYKEAPNYFDRAFKIRKEIGDMPGMANVLNNMGINQQSRGNYAQALNYCKQSLAILEDIETLRGQKDACECIYDAYKAMGKGNEALVYLEKIRTIEDSLNSEETNQILQQMEFEKQVLADSLKTAKKEQLIEEAHQEEVRKKNRTRNTLLGGGALVLLLAGGLYSRLRYVRNSKAVLQVEKDRSENLLLNILPADIAEELKAKGKADARDFDLVSILFTDFKGFTAASEKLSAQDLVSEINTCFQAFDGIVGKYNIEKIKTIGDAYMCAGGLPVPDEKAVKNTVLAAMEMQEFIQKRKAERDAASLPAFAMRVGVHTGPVVAGIVGVKKFQYDIWGDTVNTASRMESSGEVGKVNISEATYELLKNDSDFTFESRGKIEAKGKGEIEMFFVSRV